MNGTIIDIPGIHVNISTIDLEDSTDKAYIIEIKDEREFPKVSIEICFGKITNVRVYEKGNSS